MHQLFKCIKALAITTLPSTYDLALFVLTFLFGTYNSDACFGNEVEERGPLGNTETQTTYDDSESYMNGTIREMKMLFNANSADIFNGFTVG